MSGLEEFEGRWLARLVEAVRAAVAKFLQAVRSALGRAARTNPGSSYLGGWEQSLPQAERFDAMLVAAVRPPVSAAYRDAFTAHRPDQSEVVYRAQHLAQTGQWLARSQWAQGTYGQITAVLDQAATGGWTVEQTSDALEPLLDAEASDAWADSMARTVLVSAYNGGLMGSLQAEQAADPATVVRVQWLATHDARTRTAHLLADRQQTLPGIPFTVGGEPLRYPGDPLGSPGQVINCRCSLAPVAATVAALTEGHPMHLSMLLRPVTAAADAPAWAGMVVELEFGDTDVTMSFAATTLSITAGDGEPYTVELDADVSTGSGDIFSFAWSENGGPVTLKLDLGAGTAVLTVNGEKLEGTAERSSADDGQGPDFDDQEIGEPAFAAAVTACAGCPGEDAAPVGWFMNPGLDRYTPVTITADGKVFGHLAPWTDPDGQPTCHVGSPPGECIPPPHSPSDYRHFHVGSYLTADAGELAVGNLTIATDHADLALNAVRAGAHYADTGAAVAVVRAGEDAHGIWVSGSLLPGVSDQQIVTLRRAPLSGDWRPVGGQLEMVAALAVNNPGFPVLRDQQIPQPRQRVDESGRVAALVAAGIQWSRTPTDADLAVVVADRVIAVLDERQASASRAEKAGALSAAVQSTRATRTQEKALQLTARAHGRTPSARTASAPGTASEDADPEPAGLDNEDVRLIADGWNISPAEIATQDVDEEVLETLLAALTAAAGPCSLDSSPGSNWVQEAGGLPNYICRIAKHLRQKGMTTGHAIASAVNQVKKWAAGADNVKPDTRAKAAAAVAQWEALKVKSKARSAAKKAA